MRTIHEKCDERDSEWLVGVFEVSFGTQRNTVTGLNVQYSLGGIYERSTLNT